VPFVVPIRAIRDNSLPRQNRRYKTISTSRSWKDALKQWSRASLGEISLNLPSWIEDVLDRSWGDEEKEEITELASKPPASGPRAAVVFLPGIMGSLLTSIRGITTALWISPSIFLKGKANLLELNHDGTGDRYPEVEIVPVGIEQATYMKLLLTLDKETELFRFPYDWRRDIEWNADVLHEYLERWASENGERQFTLVGHSMGGLVAWAYMARHPRTAEKRIRRLIMQGTPQWGVTASVEVMARGNTQTRLLASLNESNDIRRLILSMPSLYQLLPPPQELFPADSPYPVNWDLYDAKAWLAGDIRQDYLDKARDFHTLLATVRPQVEIADIVGCRQATLTQMHRLGEAPPIHQVIYNETKEEGGDGTVPLWSVRRPDISTYYVNAIHIQLPTAKKVMQATLELIHDGVPALPGEVPLEDEAAGILSQLPDLATLTHLVRERLEQGKMTIEDLRHFHFL